MNIGPYHIHVDALLARLIYRRRLRAAVLLVLLSAVIGMSTSLVPPFWRGRATLTITATDGARLQVDGKNWPHTLYAGAHRVLATRPDGRQAWADVQIQANAALTLTLPAGLPQPRERALPPAAPGTHIDHIWWADGAWRVRSVRDIPPATDTERAAYLPTPTPDPGQTVAVANARVERLATLDAYDGLADQVHRDGQRVEAVYQADPRRNLSDSALGTIAVRGWRDIPLTVPLSSTLTLLRFSPPGDALLFAERVPGGEQVYLLTPDHPPVPIVAIPGQIVRLSWPPDGQAVVIHSVQGERLTLTLARFAPSVVAAAIADLPVSAYPQGLVPLIWDAAALLWVAPDPHGQGALWRAPLLSLLPERHAAMDARALTRLADGTLRAVVVRDHVVTIGRYQGEVFIGETTVPSVPATPDLVGEWQGDELLLHNHARAWLLQISEGT